jgi:hypothetical protein
VIENTNDIRDPAKKRLARSHGVKSGLKTKRSKLIENLDNFRIVNPGDDSKRRPSLDVARQTPRLNAIIGVEKLDPFDSLPVDATALQLLLHRRMLH